MSVHTTYFKVIWEHDEASKSLCVTRKIGKGKSSIKVWSVENVTKIRREHTSNSPEKYKAIYVHKSMKARMTNDVQ